MRSRALASRSSARCRCACSRVGTPANPQAWASARTARTRAPRATLPEGERGRLAPLQASSLWML
eukprot:14089732-Alexandrium_andersonii.AAC.1